MFWQLDPYQTFLSEVAEKFQCWFDNLACVRKSGKVIVVAAPKGAAPFPTQFHWRVWVHVPPPVASSGPQSSHLPCWRWERGCCLGLSWHHATRVPQARDGCFAINVCHVWTGRTGGDWAHIPWGCVCWWWPGSRVRSLFLPTQGDSLSGSCRSIYIGRGLVPGCFP